MKSVAVGQDSTWTNDLNFSSHTWLTKLWPFPGDVVMKVYCPKFVRFVLGVVSILDTLWFEDVLKKTVAVMM